MTGKGSFHRFLPLILGVAFLTACSAQAPPAAAPAGGPKTARTIALETGAEILQPEGPIDAVAVYLDAFHFHNGNIEQQMEAHHYCTDLNEDFTQCIIYSGNGADALLMGIEYVISERLFRNLGEEERQLWHSHHYEVKSGQLIAPGLPRAAQHALKCFFGTGLPPSPFSRQSPRDLPSFPNRRLSYAALFRFAAGVAGARQTIAFPPSRWSLGRTLYRDSQTR